MSLPSFDVVRIGVRTLEADDRVRTQDLAVSTLEWRAGRAVVLRRVAEMLDAACDAADQARRTARIAGPRGVLP